MDRCKYLEIINSIFFQQYKQRKKANSLMISIVYSFNLISKENFNIWNICYMILKKNKSDSETYRKFFYIMTVFYCFFTSYQNTYNLPCFLNKKIVNDSITHHLIFGEHITQLVNFILISEAINIIEKNFESQQEILDLVEFCYSELNWFTDDSVLISEFGSFKQKDVENSYYEMHYKLFRFAILITYKLIGKTSCLELELSIKKLYKISFPKYSVNNATQEI